MKGPWFYVALGAIAAVLWVPIGLPISVVASYNMNLGVAAHLGLLAGTYAICFVFVVAIAWFITRRRRAS